MQTKGFRDLIDIGNQTRPFLFQLAIKKVSFTLDVFFLGLIGFLHTARRVILEGC